MDATERDVRQLSETLDFLEDLLAPGAEDLSEVLGGTLRECQELRDRLQEAVPDILDRDGGEATFNQIAALLERMERVKDQWQARGASGGNRSPPSGSSMAHMAQPAPAPSLPASALTSAASGSVPPVPAVPVSALAPSASPAQSHASEDMWRQTSGLGSMEKEKEKKKKRKEGKELKESKEKDLGDQGKEGKGSEDGFPDSFGAWPDSGEASAFPESFGGWGAPLGSSPAPAFEASNWARGVSAEGPTPGACGPCASGASAGPSPFAAFGSLPEPAPIAPSSLSEKGQKGDANAQAEGTLASLHVGYPFAAIAEDKEAFERLFVRAAAQAAGVAPRRIRVHAVRPGPGY